jgi:hypothetical protein
MVLSARHAMSSEIKKFLLYVFLEQVKRHTKPDLKFLLIYYPQPIKHGSCVPEKEQG